MSDPWKRKEVIEDCTLYLGNSLHILPSLGLFDSTITDPPYGVGEGVGPGLRKNRKEKTAYNSFDDTRENIEQVIVPAFELALSASKYAAVTTGFKSMFLYPKPKHVGGFQYAGSTVMSAWGPCLWQPIYYYGKDPHQGKLRPDSFPNCNDVDRDTDHPCPKPLGQWMKLVDRASRQGDLVCDPFMGSGTTGVACVKLGRRFVGIEIDEGYFDTACQRIKKAVSQPDMLIQALKPPDQVGMDF